MIRRLGLLVLFVGLRRSSQMLFSQFLGDDQSGRSWHFSRPDPEVAYGPSIPSFWRNYRGFPDYDNELISDYFGIYAAYASNVYRPIPA